MAKRPHTGEVTGQGTTGWTDAGGTFVVLTGRVTGPNDTGRPIRLKMTPQEARERAALLIDMAERIEIANGPKYAPAPEGEPEGEPENGMVDGARDMLRDAAQVLDELQGYGDLPISSGLIARVRALADEVGAIGEPEQPKSAFAQMLAGKAPVHFTETRPGTWQTATPEDGARLDDAIDSALAGLGTSLSELRAAPGVADMPCKTCGSLTHSQADGLCPEGVEFGAFLRAYRKHTEYLPGDVAGCAAAGHCGHAPCCNCSGQRPTAEITADVLAGGTDA